MPVRVEPISPSTSLFSFPVAEVGRIITVMQPMLACFHTFSAYCSGDGWIRRYWRWSGGIRFRPTGIFSIAITNPGFTLDCLYAFLKSCKRAVWEIAGEIRAPGIVLRTSAVQSGPDKKRDRDCRSPRHPDLPASSRDA